MEEIEMTSNRKQFEIFIPKDCDLNTVNKVVIRGREFLPVVHGEWIWEDGICSPRICSVCKHKFYIGRGWNFCPNCGAKMDGKEKDDALDS